MSKRQNNLLQIWKKKIKKPLVEINLVSDSDGEEGTDGDTESDYDRMPSARETCHERDKDFDELQNEQSLEECHQAVNSAEPMDEDNRSHSAQLQQAEDLVENLDERVSDNDSDAQSSLLPVEVEVCQSLCCSEIIKPFHPTDKKTVQSLSNDKRNFMPHWYQAYPWLSVCTTKKKVFYCYCRYAEKLDLLKFTKRNEGTFATIGFNKWKKALEKFKHHSQSISHREAVMKCHQLQKAPIDNGFNLRTQKEQASRRNALLKQLDAVKFLLRQGLSFRGHDDLEGNLRQLLVMLSRDDEDVKSWIKENKYISHEIVNDKISIMANTLLRSLLARTTENSPSWYSIIGDEATDVAKREQFNLTIRWVNNDYDVAEDPIGLYCLPNTTADTLHKVIKDILIRCSLPLSLCRGQAYDGAANMQGKRTGVATRILKENPAALPVHCLAHSLNLCLQDAGRQVQLLRDALDVVKEMCQLIKFSPKRSHLFSEKLKQCDSSSVGVNIKLLCLTRWTARHGAFEAVLKDYPILMETMEEISETSHDEYGVKAKGILALMEKFSTYFGIELGFLVFGAAETLSNTLQGKDTSFQEAMSAVTLAKSFYKRIRKEEEYNRFYNRIVRKAEEVKIDAPCLPRHKRPPRRVDAGSRPHQFTTPKEFFRAKYFETCDLLLGELDERFEQSRIIPSVLTLENLLLSAANGASYEEHIRAIRDSCYKDDFDFAVLQKQLPLLVDVIKQGTPLVKKVTSVRTICEAMNTQSRVYKTMLSEIHKLLRLYLTIPITSATSERTFSALKHVLTYLRSSMSERRLNNCVLAHVHKHFLDELDIVEVAKEFVLANDDRIKHFGRFPS